MRTRLRRRWRGEGISAQGPSSFFTSSIAGDGVDDYMEVRTAANARFTQALDGNWTFEWWGRVPNTLTANECLFSSNNTNVATNLLRFTLSDRTASIGFYSLDIFLADSVGTTLQNRALPLLFATPNTSRQKIHVVITSRNTAGNYSLSYYVNGQRVGGTLDNASTGVTTASSFGFNYFMDRAVAGRYSDAKMYNSRFYTRELSAAEISQTYNGGKGAAPIGASCLFDFTPNNRTGNDFADGTGSSNKLTAVNFANVAANVGTVDPEIIQKRIVMEGNSLVWGQNTTSPLTNLPFLVNQVLANPVTYETCYNLGIGGQRTSQILTNFPGKTVGFYNPNRSQNIYVLDEVINDLASGGLTAAQAISNYVAVCNLAKGAGYKVVVCTPGPRSDVGTPGTFEADRQTVAAYLRANYLSFGDALADITANATIGAAGSELNTTYYAVDHVHMTDAGYLLRAGIIKDAILTIA